MAPGRHAPEMDRRRPPRLGGRARAPGPTHEPLHRRSGASEGALRCHVLPYRCSAMALLSGRRASKRTGMPSCVGPARARVPGRRGVAARGRPLDPGEGGRARRGAAVLGHLARARGIRSTAPARPARGRRRAAARPPSSPRDPVPRTSRRGLGRRARGHRRGGPAARRASGGEPPSPRPDDVAMPGGAGAARSAAQRDGAADRRRRHRPPRPSSHTFARACGPGRCASPRAVGRPALRSMRAAPEARPAPAPVRIAAP